MNDNDLISRKELKGYIEQWFAMVRYYHPFSKSTKIPKEEVFDIIDNTPTVNLFCSYMSDGEVKQPCVEGPCEQLMPKSSLDKPLYEGVLFVDDFGINKVIEVDEHGTVTAERIISKDIFIEAYNKYISGYEKGGKK